MSPTRAEQAAQTRRTVLDTARRLFAEQGYDATSLQLIADTMGVTKANVYYYFRSKADLLEALLQCSIAAFDALLDAAAALDDPRARRELLADGFVEQVVAQRSLSLLDPSARRHETLGRALEAQATRGLHLLYGATPTPDETAAYAMATELGPALRSLGHLPDAELRATLRRLCLRVLEV
ncbi:TetR/AcrR family transcriptional regulator [Amycolatopsis sp. FDAARGOS 1241]|uniref:TetR/AcrR family transcriptional regulator n=1 Tax=Amycolatopsis sp. FDAARGOS 1241 TaxID=2778070 RepID=UPI0019519A4A|nr:helix-turn-helix domain-containing protein [Amycolatopsis sp. FDAARGOS 1241]QRP47160.1 helix-turn-helix transcriptional regulator [Amycolatopsis sp. FDAARGOS 1241]